MSKEATMQVQSRNFKAPGVATLNARLQRSWRYLVLAVVILPLLALVIGVFLIWRYGISLLEISTLVVMYSITLFGISIGFHRCFSHRSFQTSKTMRRIFLILGSMAVQGPILTWAAVHRRHHQYSDRRGDPHSPYVYADGATIGGLMRGLWHSHMGWLFTTDVTDWGHYVPDLLRDKLVFKFNQLYPIFAVMGLLLPGVVMGLITRTWVGLLMGILWGGIIRVCLVHHASWTVGSLSHIFGSQPFNTQDNSRNNFWLSLITLGDSWQNNHHAFPSSAIHGLAWWQLDPSGWVIHALRQARLIWNVETPPPHLIAAKQKQP